MKRDIKLGEISKKLGLSKSTVSKALNNKAGVDEKTKSAVVDCAKKMGYFHSGAADASVFALFPIRYKEVCEGIKKAFAKEGLGIECAIYLNDEDYIRNLLIAEKAAYEIVILCPCASCEDQIVRRISKKSMVWFTADVLNIENTFYFGINPMQAAKQAANKIIAANKRQVVLIRHSSEIINKKALEIVSYILKQSDTAQLRMVSFDENSMLSVPLMARKLSHIGEFDSVCCSRKILNYVEGALKKLNKSGVLVFCIEEADSIKRVCELVAKNAKRYIEEAEYPICKYLFV